MDAGVKGEGDGGGAAGKKRKKKEERPRGREKRRDRKEARKRKKTGRIGRQTEEGWKQEARTRGENGRARAHGSLSPKPPESPAPRGTEGAARRCAVSKRAVSHPPRPATTQPHAGARRGSHVLPNRKLHTLTAPRGFRTSHKKRPRKDDSHRTAPCAEHAEKGPPGVFPRLMDQVSVPSRFIKTRNLTTGTKLVLERLCSTRSVLPTEPERLLTALHLILLFI